MVQQRIFLPESTLVQIVVRCLHSLLCSICVHVKNDTDQQPYHCLDTCICCTQIGMGGAAVAAAVHYAGQATPISHKG